MHSTADGSREPVGCRLVHGSKGIQDNVVSIVSDKAMGCTVQGSNLDKGKRFFSPPKHIGRLWSSSSLLFFPRPWHIVDHSPPSRTNVKNMWSNNSAPLYALMAWTRTNLPLPYPYSNPGTKTNHSAPRCLQVSPGKCRYNIVK